MTPAQMYEAVVNDLRVGDVISTYSRPKSLKMWIVFKAIQYYQIRKRGRKSDWWPIHSQLYLGEGMVLDNAVFSYEYPVAVIKPLKIGHRTRRIAVSRLGDADTVFSQDWIDTMNEAANRLVGRKYDVGQLIDIMLKMLFPDFIRKTLSIFDRGKKYKVCSVAVHAILLKAWKANIWRWEVPMMTAERFGKVIMKENAPPRPLGRQYVEITCPADFLEDETFEIVKEVSC